MIMFLKATQMQFKVTQTIYRETTIKLLEIKITF